MASSSSDGSYSESESSSSSSSSRGRRPQPGGQSNRRLTSSTSESGSSGREAKPKSTPCLVGTSPSQGGMWAGYEESDDDIVSIQDDGMGSSQRAQVRSQSEEAVSSRSPLAAVANDGASALKFSPQKQIDRKELPILKTETPSDPAEDSREHLRHTVAEDLHIQENHESRMVEIWLRFCSLRLKQEYEAEQVRGVKLSQTLRKEKEERRRLQLEDEARKLKLQEEAELRQRRIKEEHDKKEAEARQRQERRLKEVRRKKAELQELQTREAAFWRALAPENEQRLRGMLQAVVLYQQQLAQNEKDLADLHERITVKEKAYQKLRQRVQRASHDTDVARELEDRARDEIGRWSRKREQYENPGEDIESLRRCQHSLRRETQKLREQHDPLQVEAGGLREKLTAADEKSAALANQLVSIRSQYQQATVTLQAENVEELAALHAKQTEEFSRLEVDIQNGLGGIRMRHAQEASTLRLAFEEANRRKEKLRHERDFTADQLLEGQREGARLHGLFTDARQEVVELSAQLKAVGAYPLQITLSGSRSRSRSMSQIGKSAPPSPAVSQKLDSSICSNAGGKHSDSEMQMLRKRCKELEKECARTHAALEKKQDACDMWRKRSFDQSWASVASSDDNVPFTLGPTDKDVSSLRLLSPNGTRTL